MITREEIIEVCNKLGLVEFHSPIMQDFRPWKYHNKIFKCSNDATVVVIPKDNNDALTKDKLYFYNKLKHSKVLGYSMECDDMFKAYCTKDGHDYAEKYNKKTFETALKNVIKKIKKAEYNTNVKRKLKNIDKDFK